MSLPVLEQNLDPIVFRDVLGQYPTGVCAITAIAEDGEAMALIVGTFTSVSLEPALIGFLPMKSSFVFEKIRSAASFAVNVLGHDQEALCRQLARPVSKKLDTVAWTPSPRSGAPLLDDALAYIECDMHSVNEAGDHFIALGYVRHLEMLRAGSPLIFLQGGFGGFAPPAYLVATDHQLAVGVRDVQHFQSELDEFAQSHDACIDVFALIGDDAANVGFAAPDGSQSDDLLGARYPVIPPFGEHFIALGPGTEERWFGRARGFDDTDRAHYGARLELIREQKWTYTLAGDVTKSALIDAVREYADRVMPGNDRRLARSAAEARPAFPTDLPDQDAEVAIGTLLAPVESSSGEVRFVLRMTLNGRKLSGRQLRDKGESLLHQAQLIAEKLNADDSSLPEKSSDIHSAE